MSTTAQINDSLRLGGAMLREIGQIGRLHKPGVEQAGFAVLKAPDIPSVLVETAFISNPEEEVKLRSEAYQEALADALMKGIQAYFARNPASGAKPPGVSPPGSGRPLGWHRTARLQAGYPPCQGQRRPHVDRGSPLFIAHQVHPAKGNSQFRQDTLEPAFPGHEAARRRWGNPPNPKPSF
jgi:hypothetical protein